MPVCLAMASSLLDLPVPEKTLAIGEVGLGGEVRSVPHLETRLREAQRVGFDTAIVPKHNLNMLDAAQFPGCAWWALHTCGKPSMQSKSINNKVWAATQTKRSIS
mgnify:FL=1